MLAFILHPSPAAAGTVLPLIGQLGIYPFGDDYQPAGWLPAQGQVLDKSIFEAVSWIVEDNYGPSTATSFTAPDLRGRLMLSTDGTPGATGGNRLAQFGPIDPGQGVPIQTQPQSSGQSHNLFNRAPSLILDVTFATQGYFPEEVGSQDFTGAIVGFLGDYVPDGYLPCDGRVLAWDSQYVALFDAIGTTYGDGQGDGKTFTLPDLNGRAPLGSGSNSFDNTTYTAGQIGGSPYAQTATTSPQYATDHLADITIDITPPYLEIKWMISTGGGQVDNSDYYLGTIMPWAGQNVPSGWMKVQGQELDVVSNSDLHSLLGYTFGGGGDKFRLPDLSGRFPLAVDPVNDAFLGWPSGGTPVYPTNSPGDSSKGVVVWDTEPSVGLAGIPPYQVVDYIICVEGGKLPEQR